MMDAAARPPKTPEAVTPATSPSHVAAKLDLAVSALHSLAGEDYRGPRLDSARKAEALLFALAACPCHASVPEVDLSWINHAYRAFKRGPTVPDTPVRRLARITVDVLLPPSHFDIDLSEVEVESVRIKHDEPPLTDIIQASVVPARLVPVDHERCATCGEEMRPCPWGGRDCPACDKGHHDGPDYSGPQLATAASLLHPEED